VTLNATVSAFRVSYPSTVLPVQLPSLSRSAATGRRGLFPLLVISDRATGSELPPVSSHLSPQLLMRYEKFISPTSTLSENDNDAVISDLLVLADQYLSEDQRRGRSMAGVKAVEMALTARSEFTRRFNREQYHQRQQLRQQDKYNDAETDYKSVPGRNIPVRLVTESLRVLSRHQSRKIQPRSTFDPANPFSNHGDLNDPSYRAIKLLQHLISGHALSHPVPDVTEKEFSAVLNTCANHERMTLARRVASLQRRTGIPLSAVAYCILIKGYGRIGQGKAIDTLLYHMAKDNDRPEPDVILMNAALDAYVRCRRFDGADRVLAAMEGGMPFYFDEGVDDTFVYRYPAPNVRTYNTALKGLALRMRREGEGEALDFDNEDDDTMVLLARTKRIVERIRSKGMWGTDPVTTNTVVDAAVRAGDFNFAELLLKEVEDERMLQQHSRATTRSNKRVINLRHYVEAYTSLLDGHAKAGNISAAMDILRHMRRMGADPNAITYTCLIGGFARAGRVREALQFLQKIEEKNGGQPASVVTYNAFLSGLIASQPRDISPSARADSALALLRHMELVGARPNIATSSLLVVATTRDLPTITSGDGKGPFVLRRAADIVQRLENRGYVTPGHPVPHTALLRACGDAADLVGATAAFGGMKPGPDVVALNAFLDVCCRCGNLRMALEVFGKYVGGQGTVGNSVAPSSIGDNEGKGEKKFALIRPDVITFSTLILNLGTEDSKEVCSKIQRLYKLMRNKWEIYPDKELVDGYVGKITGIFQFEL